MRIALKIEGMDETLSWEGPSESLPDEHGTFAVGIGDSEVTVTLSVSEEEDE